MLDWITSHRDNLNLLANWTMVAIWVVYLQIFLRSFRRQTLPKIVINRAAGRSLRAACFVSNMSTDAIYIESVIATIVTRDDRFTCAITDFEDFDNQANDADPKRLTFQGVLPPSQYTSLGTFGDLIALTARKKGIDYEGLKSNETLSIEITIIADYAAEKLLIGASRAFQAEWHDDRWNLSEKTPETHQIRSRAKRKRIMDTLLAVGD